MKRDIVITMAESTSPIMQSFSPSNRYSGIGRIAPTGISITYPINDVPTARITVGPDALPLVCDIEKYRRHPIRVNVETINGCLAFDGLLDGVSINQSPGNLSMQLILKHPMQVLKEINPMWLGYQSGGIDFTKRTSPLSTEISADGAFDLRNKLGPEIQPLTGLSVNKGAIELLKVIVKSQQNWSTLAKQPDVVNWKYIASITDVLRKQHLPMALLLLDAIDAVTYATSYLTLSDFMTLGWVLKSIIETRTNLFDMLVSIINEVGCSLIIGNEKAYIVPNVGFLKLNHVSDVRYQQFSTIPNVIFPSQYSSFSFSDSGYKDISGVYVLSDSKSFLNSAAFVDKNIETAGKGGILGLEAPRTLSYNIAAMTVNNPKLRRRLHDRQPTHDVTTAKAGAKGKGLVDDFRDSYIKEDKAKTEELADASKFEAASRAFLQKFLDNWAEVKYYENKYTDRVGSYSCAFLPNFVPGAIGSIYLRQPGVFVDHYVERVTHDIQVNAPNNGVATTTVGFSCGRMGSIGTSLLASGVDSLDLYEYDASKSIKFATDFLNSNK